jgi:uncharacterized protein (TIGR00369 family)
MTIDWRDKLESVNAGAPFNRWATISVEEADPGRCVLAMPWRTEFGQYSGFLHAGMVAALLDTTCGFAAATELGPLLTSQLSISYLAPAVGELFRAEATLVRGGRRQAFSDARLFARGGGDDRLVATASAVLLRSNSAA